MPHKFGEYSQFFSQEKIFFLVLPLKVEIQPLIRPVSDDRILALLDKFIIHVCVHNF